VLPAAVDCAPLQARPFFSTASAFAQSGPLESVTKKEGTYVKTQKRFENDCPPDRGRLIDWDAGDASVNRSANPKLRVVVYGKSILQSYVVYHVPNHGRPDVGQWMRLV
jgi:hypothetical protein